MTLKKFPSRDNIITYLYQFFSDFLVAAFPRKKLRTKNGVVTSTLPPQGALGAIGLGILFYAQMTV